MLTGIWERLRGYDKWVAAEATIESSKMKETPHMDRSGNLTYTYDSRDVLLWTDKHGEGQRAYFEVPDDSPLYQLVGGEKLNIRYNPDDPEQYYFRELLQTRVRTFVKRAAAILIFVCIIFVAGLLRAGYLLH